MTGFGDNTFRSPFEIEEAREAQYQASKNQRAVETRVKDAATKLAAAERAYRTKLTQRILALHAGEGDVKGLAITMCETVAKGEMQVADLRYARDIARGVLEAARQEAFACGADRRGLDALIDWSMKRELRVETPPPEFQRPTLEPVA